VVTFDDGLREQYETAWPILQRLSIPAIFFINTAPIVHTRISAVHKIHMIRASFGPTQVVELLHQEASHLGIAMDLLIDDAKVMGQYKYDGLNTARLKYLLNFLLAPSDRDKVIEACFRRCFPDAEREISKRLYMDVSQVQDLASCGCIGTHGHDHLPLGMLSPEMAREQIDVSAAYLRRWTGEAPVALSYPYGSMEACSLEAGRIAKESGIEFAFTMERAANADLQRPMFLSRFSSSDLPGGNASKWTIETLFDSLPHSGWYRQPKEMTCSTNLA
jgi:peptidoglycan/xylan/chitin deacetylase (PgdA/CDA1 family)